IVQTARAMFDAGESADAVREAIAEWVDDLAPLRRQLELQHAVTTALDGFIEGLDTGARGLDRFIRELGRAVFVPGYGYGGLRDFAFGLVGMAIGAIFGGG